MPQGLYLAGKLLQVLYIQNCYKEIRMVYYHLRYQYELPSMLTNQSKDILSTWSVLRLEGRMKPKNCSSDTHLPNRA